MHPILKYPGAKWKIAPFLVNLLPPHLFYLEPWFGSGALFFSKPPCKHETINDINGDVVNFFKCCREFPEKLCEALQLTPYARDEFLEYQEARAGAQLPKAEDPIENARRFAVRCCMGFGAKQSDRVGFKVNRTSAGPQCAKLWSRMPESVAQAAQRLKGCTIENTDALELIEKHNHQDCLIYADPPYLMQTRSSGRLYRHEAGDASQHERILHTLLRHIGPVMLSGYESDLYNDLLQGWRKEQVRTTKTSSIPCTETVYLNYELQQSLFTLEEVRACKD